jgi:hypothetical protein
MKNFENALTKCIVIVMLLKKKPSKLQGSKLLTVKAKVSVSYLKKRQTSVRPGS